MYFKLGTMYNLFASSYSRINSTQSPGSGTGNISWPGLMSQVGRVRKFVCAEIIVFLQSVWWRCQFVCLCSSCYCGLMINSTKSVGSGKGNVSEPRLMSQVGRVRKFVCA